MPRDDVDSRESTDWVDLCQLRLKTDPLEAIENRPPRLLVLFGDGRGDAAEFSVLQAVGVALQGDDLGVVNESVDHRGGDGVVAEDLAPAGEVLVGRDDQAGSFVAGGDELE